MRISDWSSDVCSSDLIDDALGVGVLCREADQARAVLGEDLALFLGPAVKTKAWHGVSRGADEPADPWPSGSRSEEHTSELQSLMRISYAVFCLKKKKTRNNLTTVHIFHSYH